MDRRSRQAPQLAATEPPTHHRTTGELRQGVDGRLLCPVINKPSPNPPPGGAFQWRRGCGKTAFGGGRRMSFSSNDTGPQPQKAETTLVTAGRDTKAQKGFVNPPVVHGSTVLYPTAEDLHAHRGEFQYGRRGTPTTKALQQAMAALEGPQCAGVGIAPSGLAAITTTLLAVLKAGDHLLVCDNAYRPTRNFCNGVLARFGIETSYFDSQIGTAVGELFRPNTRAVLVEAPGSQSFE